jgi:hypothetical protein
MKTAYRLLPIVILLFGASLIWGRINREIVRQVRAEELRVDRSIVEMREAFQERAEKASGRPIHCGMEWRGMSAEEIKRKIKQEDEDLEAEEQTYRQFVRKCDTLLELRQQRRSCYGGATGM